MLQLITVTACMILTQGLYTTDAQAIRGCTDQLTASLANGKETCLAGKDYFECIFLETDLYKTLNRTGLSFFKAQIQDFLAEKGIHCDINVTAIVNELLENDRNGIVHTTYRPKGYKSAKTEGECLDTLIAEAAPELTCDQATSYFKCIIRVAKIHTLTSSQREEFFRLVEQKNLDVFDELKVECHTTISDLIREVRREEGIEDGSASQQVSLSFLTVLILTFASVLLVY